jgi:putative tricarboxylic transport membrane protein
MILALVLGYMIEGNFRRSLSLSGGDYMTFVENPVSAGLLGFALLLVVGSLVRDLVKKRRAMSANAAVS